MKAIMVCVDYADILELTLPYNRHHFDEIHVITTPTDSETRRTALANKCEVWETDLFYANGADFNKYLAIEYCLDHIGRDGWLSVMDSDVVWPHNLPEFDLIVGKLYTPYRRMCRLLPTILPSEDTWYDYPIHGNINEWSGYTHIFHASDSNLGKKPWYDVDWKHAGGADSVFQSKWHRHDKVRPPFHALHLGEGSVNWCGRTTAYSDGTTPRDAQERKNKLEEYRKNRGQVQGIGRCSQERIGQDVL